ncbi:MAG TPA: hypothetical protein VN408_38480 [Actinoplanes sp.]|nr:hypothetical protein [Actinoplanes sp.]
MSYEDDEYWEDEYSEYSFMPSSAVIQERHYTKREVPDAVMPTRRRADLSEDELAARRQKKASFDSERPSWLDEPDFVPVDTNVDNLVGDDFDDIDFNRPELGIDFDKPDFPIVDPAARPDLRRGAPGSRGENRYERKAGDRYASDHYQDDARNDLRDRRDDRDRRDRRDDRDRPAARDRRDEAPRARRDDSSRDDVARDRRDDLGRDRRDDWDRREQRDDRDRPAARDRDDRRDEVPSRRGRSRTSWEDTPDRWDEPAARREEPGIRRDEPGIRRDEPAARRDERWDGYDRRDDRRDQRDERREPLDDRRSPGRDDRRGRGRRTVEIRADEMWDDDGVIDHGDRAGRDDERHRTIELASDEYWEEPDRSAPDRRRGHAPQAWDDDDFGPIRPAGGRRPRRDDADIRRPAAQRDERAVTGRAQVPGITGADDTPQPIRGTASPARGEAPQPIRGEVPQPVRGEAAQPVRGTASPARDDVGQPVRGTASPARDDVAQPVRGTASPVRGDGRPAAEAGDRDLDDRRVTSGEGDDRTARKRAADRPESELAGTSRGLGSDAAVDGGLDGRDAVDPTVAGRETGHREGFPTGDPVRGTDGHGATTEVGDRSPAGTGTTGPQTAGDETRGRSEVPVMPGADGRGGSASGPGGREVAESGGREAAGTPGREVPEADGSVAGRETINHREPGQPGGGVGGPVTPQRAPEQSGPAAYGTGQPGPAQRGPEQTGPAGYGTAQPGAGQQQGPAGYGTGQPGSGQQGPAQHGAAQHGATQHGHEGSEREDGHKGGWRAAMARLVPGQRHSAGPAGAETAAEPSGRQPHGDDGAVSGADGDGPRVVRRAEPPVPPKVVSKSAPPPAPRVLKADPPVAPRVIAAPSPVPPARVIGAQQSGLDGSATASGGWAAGTGFPAADRRAPENIGGERGPGPAAVESQGGRGAGIVPGMNNRPGGPSAGGPVDGGRMPGGPIGAEGPGAGIPVVPGVRQPDGPTVPGGPRAGDPVGAGGQPNSGPLGPNSGPLGPDGRATGTRPGENGQGTGARGANGPAADGWAGDNGLAGVAWAGENGRIPGDWAGDNGPGSGGWAGDNGRGSAGRPGDSGRIGGGPGGESGRVPGGYPEPADGRRSGDEAWGHPGEGWADVPQQRSRRTPRTAHVFLEQGDGPWAMVPDASQPPAGSRPVSPARPQVPGEFGPGTVGAPGGYPAPEQAWPPAARPATAGDRSPGAMPPQGWSMPQPGMPYPDASRDPAVPGRQSGPGQPGTGAQPGTGTHPAAGQHGDAGQHRLGQNLGSGVQAGSVSPESAWPPAVRAEPAAGRHSSAASDSPTRGNAAPGWEPGMSQAGTGAAPQSGSGWHGNTSAPTSGMSAPRSGAGAHAAPSTGWNGDGRHSPTPQSGTGWDSVAPTSGGTIPAAPTSGADVPGTDPIAGRGPLSSAPTSGRGPLGTAPTSDRGPLSSAPTSGRGPLGSAPASDGGPLGTAPAPDRGLVGPAPVSGGAVPRSAPPAQKGRGAHAAPTGEWSAIGQQETGGERGSAAPVSGGTAGTGVVPGDRREAEARPVNERPTIALPNSGRPQSAPDGAGREKIGFPLSRPEQESGPRAVSEIEIEIGHGLSAGAPVSPAVPGAAAGAAEWTGSAAGETALAGTPGAGTPETPPPGDSGTEHGGISEPARGGFLSPARNGSPNPAPAGASGPAQGGSSGPAQGGNSGPAQGGSGGSAQDGTSGSAQGGQAMSAVQAGTGSWPHVGTEIDNWPRAGAKRTGDPSANDGVDVTGTASGDGTAVPDSSGNGADEQFPADSPYMDPDGTLHNLRPIGRLENAGPTVPARTGDSAFGSGWFVAKAGAETTPAADTKPAPAVEPAAEANPGDAADSGATADLGAEDAAWVQTAGAEDAAGAEATGTEGTSSATAAGAATSGTAGAGPKSTAAKITEGLTGFEPAGTAVTGTGPDQATDNGAEKGRAANGSTGPEPVARAADSPEEPTAGTPESRTPMANAPEEQQGPDLAPHLPLTAADLSAIRWRLDGGTLREVVDDRDALRELGERLDGPLTDEADNIVKAGLLSVRAEVYRLLGELGMAAAASRLALAHAESAQDLQSQVIAQAELAHVLRLRGDYMEADRLFQRAVEADVAAAVRSVVHENAGRSCFDQGRHMEALDHFARAIRLGAQEDSDLVERVGVCLEAVYIRVLRDGWGPYPRRSPEILAPLNGKNGKKPAN